MHGPGIVIGRDGKQIIAIHGGTFHRVHECRLTKVPCSNNKNVTDMKGCNSEMQNGSEINKSLKADVRGKQISTTISDDEDNVNEEAVGVTDDIPEEINGSVQKNLASAINNSEKRDDSSTVYDNKVRVRQ